jgi:hypothetical protein
MRTEKDDKLATQDEATALRLIEALLALRGLSRKDLDRRIGRTPGYVTQILNGTVGTKFSMLITMIRALEFEPEVFFRTLFKRSRPLVFGPDPASMAQVLERLREMDIEPPLRRRVPPAETIDLEALEVMVQRAVADALARLQQEKSADAASSAERAGHADPGKRSG